MTIIAGIRGIVRHLWFHYLQRMLPKSERIYKGSVMITEELINNFTSMFTWSEPGVTNYFVAFYTHHRILNDVLEKMNEENSIIHQSVLRVSYLFYTNYVSFVYAELSLTVECLLKMLLVEYESQCGHTHELGRLLEYIHGIDNEKVKDIYQILIGEEEVLKNFDTNKVFINYRYLENQDDKFVLEHMSYIKGLLLAVEKIYLKYYQDFNFAELTYGSI